MPSVWLIAAKTSAPTSQVKLSGQSKWARRRKIAWDELVANLNMLPRWWLFGNFDGSHRHRQVRPGYWQRPKCLRSIIANLSHEADAAPPCRRAPPNSGELIMRDIKKWDGVIQAAMIKPD
jgi:hypothetical protein